MFSTDELPVTTDHEWERLVFEPPVSFRISAPFLTGVLSSLLSQGSGSDSVVLSQLEQHAVWVEYLFTKELQVDMHDAESLMSVATAFIPLHALLRQQDAMVQVRAVTLCCSGLYRITVTAMLVATHYFSGVLPTR